MGKSHPDCINSSNPYHECVDYCYKKIAEAEERANAQKLGFFFLILFNSSIVFISFIYWVLIKIRFFLLGLVEKEKKKKKELLLQAFVFV